MDFWRKVRFWFTLVVNQNWMPSAHQSHSITPLSAGQGTENMTKSSWVEIKTGRVWSLFNIRSKLGSTWGKLFVSILFIVNRIRVMTNLKKHFSHQLCLLPRLNFVPEFYTCIHPCGAEGLRMGAVVISSHIAPSIRGGGLLRPFPCSNTGRKGWRSPSSHVLTLSLCPEVEDWAPRQHWGRTNMSLTSIFVAVPGANFELVSHCAAQRPCNSGFPGSNLLPLQVLLLPWFFCWPVSEMVSGRL